MDAEQFRLLHKVSYPSSFARWQSVSTLFDPFAQLLEELFPRVHKSLTVERVGQNDLSLIFTWKGTNSSLKPLMIASHMDVVPIDPITEHQWTYVAEWSFTTIDVNNEADSNDNSGSNYDSRSNKYNHIVTIMETVLIQANNHDPITMTIVMMITV